MLASVSFKISGLLVCCGGGLFIAPSLGGCSLVDMSVIVSVKVFGMSFEWLNLPSRNPIMTAESVIISLYILRSLYPI